MILDTLGGRTVVYVTEDLRFGAAVFLVFGGVCLLEALVMMVCVFLKIEMWVLWPNKKRIGSLHMLWHVLLVCQKLLFNFNCIQLLWLLKPTKMIFDCVTIPMYFWLFCNWTEYNHLIIQYQLRMWTVSSTTEILNLPIPMPISLLSKKCIQRMLDQIFK